MSIIRMSYQCQCGAIVKIEDRSIIAGLLAFNLAVVKHEDESCG